MSTYELIDTDPTPEEYLDLREATGMSSRTIEGVERGLENTIHGVTVRADTQAIGMGRIIGDRGTTYQLVDIAVHPDFQGRGIGTEIVDHLMAQLRETAPPEAYITLLSTVEGFYNQFGFEDVSPNLQGMRVQVGNSASSQ